MAIVYAIFGFVIGLSLGSAVAVLGLSGRRNSAYWGLANRHAFVQQFVRLSIVASIVACGFVFAYWGYLLAQ